MKRLEWQFSTGIAGGIVFLLGIPGKNGMVGKYGLSLCSEIGLTGHIDIICTLPLSQS